MTFRSEEYFRAATERMRQARELFAAGDSDALAMYCAGLAVECLLRAFRWKKDRSFEGRHDLEDLLKASELLAINEERLRRKGESQEAIDEVSVTLRAAMNEVVVLWHNNLRFASEDSLRAFLKRIGRLRGAKGNAVRKNASDLLNAGQMVVDRGVALWTLRKK